jgi:solute carrier family 45, member 1/2/4
LGGHVRAVFTLITIIFVFCVSATITSFKEVPLAMLDSMKNLCSGNSYGAIDQEENGIENHGYATVPGENIPNVSETSFTEGNHQPIPVIIEEEAPNLSHYLKSIVFMPMSIRMVCMTNLFCWMAHVCYSLYFTDFVGEAVFDGDPKVETRKRTTS